MMREQQLFYSRRDKNNKMTCRMAEAKGKSNGERKLETPAAATRGFRNFGHSLSLPSNGDQDLPLPFGRTLKTEVGTHLIALAVIIQSLNSFAI